MSLKVPLPNKQLVSMCDAIEHATGYVFLLKDYKDKKTGETNKFASVVFGSKRFTTRQRSLTMYAKNFLAMHLAFDKFGHIL